MKRNHFSAKSLANKLKQKLYVVAQEMTGEIWLLVWLDGNEVDEELTDAEVLQLVGDELLTQIELLIELLSELLRELLMELLIEQLLVELRPIALSIENMLEFRVSLSGWSRASFNDSFSGSFRVSFSGSPPSSLLLS